MTSMPMVAPSNTQQASVAVTPLTRSSICDPLPSAPALLSAAAATRGQTRAPTPILVGAQASFANAIPRVREIYRLAWPGVGEYGLRKHYATASRDGQLRALDVMDFTEHTVMI
jgi:hypothetical protein